MRRERAVLAVAAARPRQRQREVAAERDAAAHARCGFYGAALSGPCGAVPRRRMRRPILAADAPLRLAVLARPCSRRLRVGFERSRRARTRPLILDFTPNAVHAGIYSAIARPLRPARASRCTSSSPSATTDSIKLLETGRVELRDPRHPRPRDRARARRGHRRDHGDRRAPARRGDRGAPDPRSPRSSRARRSASPASRATPRCSTRSSPAPAATRRGQDGHDRLQRGPGAARGPGRRRDRVLERRGRHAPARAPGLPRLPRRRLRRARIPGAGRCARRARRSSQDPALAHAVVRTLVRGYGVTLTDPEGSAADLESLVQGSTRRSSAPSWARCEPAFLAQDGRVGALDPATLQRVGAVGGAVRDRQPAARRPPDVRPEPRRRPIGTDARAQAEQRGRRSAAPPRAPSASAGRRGRSRPPRPAARTSRLDVRVERERPARRRLREPARPARSAPSRPRSGRRSARRRSPKSRRRAPRRARPRGRPPSARRRRSNRTADRG